ncbi:MAG: DUF192 domain-containing protein [Burkholderiaceae bacterium]|nr:DUF192 domain-containing protein [Burkholderiaceae bacterium]
MRRIGFSLAFGIAALALAPGGGALAQPGAAQVPQPKLPVVRLQAGIHVILAELADNDRRREIGLMGRQALGPNEGMLFVFERKAVHCFWMRNTPLALSIAFLDDDGRIVDIAQMAPRSDDSHCPSRAVRFALEMEQGWFARHGIEPGARLIQASLFSQASRFRVTSP